MQNRKPLILVICSHMINGDIREAMQVGAEYAAEVLSHYGGFWCCQMHFPGWEYIYEKMFVRIGFRWDIT